MKIERTRKRCFRRLHSARFCSALLPQWVNCTMTSFFYNYKNPSVCWFRYFSFILKLRGAHLLHPFYLRFIFCILTIGRNLPSRTKKKKRKEKRKENCTIKAAGLSISSRSGSQMVTWLMVWSTVVVWITSSDKFCSKPERPGLTRTLGMPGEPCVLSRSWAANGWIFRKQYIRTWG